MFWRHVQRDSKGLHATTWGKGTKYFSKEITGLKLLDNKVCEKNNCKICQSRKE